MLSLLKYVLRNKKLQSSNQVRLNRVHKKLKGFSPGLHNKIIKDFIKICLPKFVIFEMHRMLSVVQPVLDTLSFFNSVLILLNREKDLSHEQFVTINLRNKTPRGWIDRPRTSNLRHQTSDPNAALSFCCLLTLCLLG